MTPLLDNAGAAYLPGSIIQAYDRWRRDNPAIDNANRDAVAARQARTREQEKMTQKKASDAAHAVAEIELESEETWEDLQAVLGPRVVHVGPGARGAAAVMLLALRGGLPSEARMTRQQAIAEVKTLVDAIAAEAAREAVSAHPAFKEAGYTPEELRREAEYESGQRAHVYPRLGLTNARRTHMAKMAAMAVVFRWFERDSPEQTDLFKGGK